MTPNHLYFGLGCFMASFLWGASGERDPSAPKGGWVPPTEEELKKVESAIPAKLPAKPKQDRKLLVYSLSHGFKHNSRLIGEEMLKLIERKTGAFALTINNDSAQWTSAYLKQFDAIAVMNATSVRLFLLLYITAAAYSDAMPPLMEEKSGGRNTPSFGVVHLAVTPGGKPELGGSKTMIPGMP